jgi:outer membrane protein TolC
MEFAMRVFIFIILLFSFSSVAFAAESRQSGFDDLLLRLKQHPDIQAYVSRAESSRHYAKGELGLPDPMLTFQIQDYPIGSSRSADFEEKMIGFRQEIPRPALRQAKSRKMQVAARKTSLTADYAYSAMIAQLITVLANRQSFKEQQKLLLQQEGLFRSERMSIKGRIAANQSGTSQMSISEADTAEIRILRAELAEQEHESEAMLTNMLGAGAEAEIVPPAVKIAAWDHDPEKTYPVKIAAEDVAMAQQEVAARTAEFGPNYEIQGSYGRMNNGDNAGTVMVGVSIPLWASASQKPRLEGANAELHAVRLDLDGIKRQVTQKLDHLKSQIDTSNQKIDLLKKKNTHLETSAKALTREYGAGKADFSTYLKARRDALSARITLAQERAKNTALIADFNRYIFSGEPQ